jgi:hypothetical protein
VCLEPNYFLKLDWNHIYPSVVNCKLFSKSFVPKKNIELPTVEIKEITTLVAEKYDSGKRRMPMLFLGKERGEG